MDKLYRMDAYGEDGLHHYECARRVHTLLYSTFWDAGLKIARVVDISLQEPSDGEERIWDHYSKVANIWAPIRKEAFDKRRKELAKH